MWNEAQFLHNLSPFLYKLARVDPQESQIGARKAGQKHPEGRKPPDKRKTTSKATSKPQREGARRHGRLGAMCARPPLAP